MVFGGLQRTTTIDFPGVLACVVFTVGCNMDCFYCHNRELISSGGGRVSETDVMEFLRRRQGLLDGVVVSGGEPTLHPDLPDFLRQIRAMGYKTKLDTNGSNPSVVVALLEEKLVDYVALDIKATAGGYADACHSPHGLTRATEAALALAKSGIRWEARTTLYPGLDLDELARILALLPPAPLWRLGFFRMPESFCPEHEVRLGLPALTPTQIAGAENRLKAIQPGIIWNT